MIGAPATEIGGRYAGHGVENENDETQRQVEYHNGLVMKAMMEQV
jgi:hypothetical protein